MSAKVIVCSFVLCSLSLSASATDLPNRKSPPAPPTEASRVYEWSGFYAGVNAGYATSKTVVTPQGGSFASFDVSPTGLNGGGYVGYNYQRGEFVFGAEAEGFFTRFEGDTTTRVGGSRTNTKLEADKGLRLRLRAGYAFNNILLYVAGGYSGLNSQVRLHSLSSDTEYSNASNWRHGWNIGAGVEYALSQNWSVRAEYLFETFKPQVYATSTNEFFVDRLSDDFTINSILIGASYKF